MAPPIRPVAYLVGSERDRLLIQGFDYFRDFAPSAERYADVAAEVHRPRASLEDLISTLLRN